MIYDISLRIGYRYAGSASGGRQVLRLLPRDIPGLQRVLSSRLSVAPHPAEQVDRLDFYGNRVSEIAHRGAWERSELHMRARVDRQAAPPPLQSGPASTELAEELQRLHRLDGAAPHHFRTASPRVPMQAEITSFAASVMAEAGGVVPAVTGLGALIHATMIFDPGATDVDTAISDAFSKRRGVCQDFAHIMIAGLRGHGIPAGYVSGFLRTEPPPGTARLEGADAMHAWVRAWCGVEIGWIEFDPTNDCLAGEDHVAVAWGRDYGDVAPVRGIMRLSGGQSSEQAVDMIPVQPT